MASIFYSWQSDLDAKTNRWFIRDCLKKAIKLVNNSIGLENASREIELDHDTKGIPGTPPIFDTIIAKIKNADLILCDLSPISITENNKHCPNPNVLIEYGYGVSTLEDKRIILVINEAYIKGDLKNSLPFDLQHKRYPICFNLPINADKVMFKTQEEKLVNSFADAIKSAHEYGLFDENKNSSSFPEEISYASSFLSNNQIIGKHNIDGDFYEFSWEGKPHIFLRILPKGSSVSCKDSELLSYAQKFGLLCFENDNSGVVYVRNQNGICCCTLREFSHDPEVQSVASSVTQLFKDLSIWGMSTRGLEKDMRGVSYIPVSYLKNTIFEGIKHYLGFYKSLNIENNKFRIISGVSGIYDYAVTISSNEIQGHSIYPEITHYVDVQWGENLRELTHYFIEELIGKIYDACGLPYKVVPFQ